MAKTKTKVKSTGRSMDGIYVLKLLLYVLLGTMWLKFVKGGNVTFGLPVGFIIGLIFTAQERFKMDRKIEYAVLIISMLFGYFAPYGMYISL